MNSTEFGDQYLTCPDMFPGRVSGEPVGENSLTIVFLGTEYLFCGLSGRQTAMLRDRYADLCKPAVENGVDIVEIQVFRGNADDFIQIDWRNRDYSFDMRHEPDSVMVAGPDFMARFNRQRSLNGGLWVGLLDSELEKLAFENYFRLLVSYRMLAQGGILLHSAGVVHNDKGYLFVGHSGAGKSTIAQMSSERGLQVLSDDLNAIIKKEDKYLAGKLPFSGSFARNTISDSCYHIGFLGYIRKGDHNTFRYSHFTIAEMVSKLAANSPFVNCDPYCEEQLFENIFAIVKEYNVAEVIFDLSGKIWDLLGNPRAADNHTLTV